MDISKFVLLAFSSISVAANAQSNVTVYGAVDAGVVLSDNGAARTVSVGSGILNGSRFGLRGVEDLGGGLKASFVLEAGFETDTGAMKPYSGNYASATPAATGGAPVNGLFNRRSIVSLEGGFGSISLGRDYTPLYWASVDADPLRMGLYGNLQESIVLSGTGADRFGRVSNAIFYESPTVADVMVRLMYGLGSEGGSSGALPKQANRMLAMSARYMVGGLLLTAAYQQVQLPKVVGNPAAFTGTTWNRKDALFGFNYKFGEYSLAGGYMQIKDPQPGAKNRNVWFGGTVKLGAGTAGLEVQRLRMAPVTGVAQTGNVYAFGYAYPMSKRTTLYGSYGTISNSANAAFPLVANDPSIAPAVPGATVKATAVGIRHWF